jgi:hypothetical protein
MLYADAMHMIFVLLMIIIENIQSLTQPSLKHVISRQFLVELDCSNICSEVTGCKQRIHLFKESTLGL